MKSYLWFFGIVFWIFSVIPAIGASITLLASTITVSGLLVGVAVIDIWLGFPFLRSDNSKYRIPGVALIATGVTAFLIALALSPSGKAPAEAEFRSIYDGKAQYRKWSIAQIVPESDQLLIGAKLFGILDPAFEKHQAVDLSNQIKTIYRQLESLPEFHQSGSVLGLCYKSIFSGNQNTGHRFEYVPSGADKPMPVVLFLHGSLGNFKGYQWVWKTFADANKVAIVSPSYGYGEWRDEQGRKSIKDTLAKCRLDTRFDHSKIYLAGISNGAAGLTECLPHLKKPVAGVIYISPVIEPDQAGRKNFLSKIRNLPVFLISGEEDSRVPIDILRESLAIIRGSANLESHILKNKDHFLFFSEKEKTCELLTNWFRKIQ